MSGILSMQAMGTDSAVAANSGESISCSTASWFNCTGDCDGNSKVQPDQVT